MARGLTTAQAMATLREVGPNAMPSRERASVLAQLGAVLREPMLLLLLVATALYVVFGDITEAGALGVSVLVIISITFVQERRTERALEALRELSSPRARVLRDGQWRDVDARALVPGDVVQLAEGDRVPADALLREGAPLTVDESLLTGESVPVIRRPDANATSLGPAGEEGPGVFAGTLVGSGNARAEVMRTGPRTELGSIGAALGTIELARAPLHREVSRVVRRVAVLAISISALLAGIYLASGRDPLHAALAGITLAMSLLPEELPLVLTIFLTLGAWRMARYNVLARRAAAIETLGAVTVLCVDKTGTLTQNRMAIRRVVTATSRLDVEPDATALDESIHEVIEVGALACPQEPADPMDRAFVTLARRALGDTEHVHPDWTWVREYPLSPGLLAVTHVWRAAIAPTRAHMVVATKGAPEAIIDLCHLDASLAGQWRERAEGMARAGLRVLGVARGRALAGGALPDNPHDLDFELVGLVGLADPLRPETAETIGVCRDAGVRVVMITGDHPTTARAIARTAGLRADRVVSGSELDQALDGDDLADALHDVEVIARAAPAHKLRIIQALRASGEVVGMTGDGVNDAPALRAADVGIAMGRGSDVAREAAGLVILDDALGAIVAAIRRGRTIYDNLAKVAIYLLAVHIPIVGLALVPPLVGWPLLLAPVHIVFLELVVDPTCSIVFEQEPADGDIMRRPPRGPGARLFELRRVGFALVLGFAALAGPLTTTAYLALGGASQGVVRGLAFVALIAADLALVFAVRRRLGHARGEPRNPAIAWMLAGVTTLLALALLVPWLRGLFAFASLSASSIVLAVAAGATPVLAVAIMAARWSRRPRALVPTSRTSHSGDGGMRPTPPALHV